MSLAKYLAKKGKSPKMKLGKEIGPDIPKDSDACLDSGAPKSEKGSKKKRPAYLD